MRKLLLALFVLPALAGVAQAQLDPDDDGIGVYFDPCACNNCIAMDVGAHRAFLVITHPTSPQGVHGWEAKLTTTGPIFLTNVNVDPLGAGAINVGIAAGEYIVGVVTPMINPFTYPAVVIAIIDFYLANTTTPARFFIDGVFFHSLPQKVPAYLDGANTNIIKELKQSTGGRTFPVATINGDCAVATEDQTWGGVKALFR
ncbi:hypothetical protein FJ250_06825 [bacterium]|nr:hypothetical protein [bacterium]